MMVKAAPVAPLVVPEAKLLLQFLVVALDAPAQLDQTDQLFEGDARRQRREPLFDGLGLGQRPLDHQPIFTAHLIAMRGAHDFAALPLPS